MTSQIELRTPAEENQRLKELLSLNILDTQREERFDRYTRLLVDIFSVPAAWISLIDKDRQWFLSEIGMLAKETPRNISFCSHAIEYPDLLEIPDTLEDSFFREHPLVVAGPKIRFYAGAVVRGPSGQAIGTLCIYDRKPRQLSVGERRSLLSLARMVEIDIVQQSKLSGARDFLKTMAMRDSETGLGRPSTMIGELTERLQAAGAQTQDLLIAHIHFDNLEAVGRAHGPSVHQAFLRATVERLANSGTDSPLMGRTGSASIAVVRSLNVGETSESTTRSLMELLREPMNLNGQPIRPQFSVGVSRFPEDGDQADELLNKARLALTLPAFEPGLHFFNGATEQCVVRRHQLEERLDLALQSDQLQLHYQPLFSIDGRTMIGVEALARWFDPELGAISPGEFIPIVESSSSLSRQLTLWALRTAIIQARKWHTEARSGDFHIGVNIPAREFYRADFVDLVLQLLADYQLAPEHLMLELTEASLIENLDLAMTSMRALKARGIRLALDDFGTGYSSLSYLRQLPVDVLKIDKSFIDDLPASTEATGLARGIIDIARGLKLKVVAEGVERLEQMQLLRELGCDVIQGYLLGRPAPAAELRIT